MMVAIIGAVATVIVAVFGLVGIALKIAYDSLQEEKHEIKTDVSHLKRQVTGLLLEGRYKDDYINELRSHIELRKPPPPPHYPPQLLRIASEGLTE
jgi:uncharacterized protein YoxC